MNKERPQTTPGEEQGTTSWTSVDIPVEDNNSSTNAKIIESLTRVSIAGFAGVCVGLSKSNKAAASKIFHRSVNVVHVQRPVSKKSTTITKPNTIINNINNNSNNATKKNKMKTMLQQQKQQQQQQQQRSRSAPPPGTMPRVKTVQPTDVINYQTMYGFSFASFVAILETCRFWSPSSLMIESYYQQQQQDGDDSSKSEWPAQSAKTFPFSDDLGPSTSSTTLSISTILDYTLGGSVAGLAGGMSKQKPPPTSSSTNPLTLPSSIKKGGRRALVLSGIGTGFVLGMMAGICQASFDVAESYALQQQKKQEQIEKQRERESLLLLEEESQQQRQPQQAQQENKDEDEEKLSTK